MAARILLENGTDALLLENGTDTLRREETFFDDVRQAIIDGLDSAQAEGTGWDARRATILPVTSAVRTSSTVVTLTLVADAGYNITATETITATIPASALVGSAPLVATPTFTIAASAGAVFLAAKPNMIRQAVNRASTY